jgi:hypothetical protein
LLGDGQAAQSQHQQGSREFAAADLHSGCVISPKFEYTWRGKNWQGQPQSKGHSPQDFHYPRLTLLHGFRTL